jgi:hypothetical protein
MAKNKGNKEEKEKFMPEVSEVKDFHGCQTNLLTVKGKKYRRINVTPEATKSYYQLNLTVGKCKKILANLPAIKKFVEKYGDEE